MTEADAESSALTAVLCAVREAGIPACGVCRFAQALPLLECRAAARLPANAASIVVCLFPYYTGEHAGRNLSRYAVVSDYHRVAGELLAKAARRLAAAFPAHAFVPFTDASPIREVEAARLAGLGFIGKNGQLISREYGSYCFIGELVTSLPLPPAVPVENACGACRACVEACPAGALAPGTLVLERCRSHITQKKGVLCAAERESLRSGGLAWGCDLCTDACPHNHAPARTPIAAFEKDITPVLTAENCENLCKTRAFGWRGAAVPLRNLALLAEQPAIQEGFPHGKV